QAPPPVPRNPRLPVRPPFRRGRLTMTLPESVLTGGAWLGVALVQVTLVALLGLLAWLAVRRGGPAMRGAVLLAALVGLLVVPGLAAVAPVWLPLLDFAWLGDADPHPTDTATAALPLPPPRPPRPPAPRAEARGKWAPRLGARGAPLADPPPPPEDADLFSVPPPPPDDAGPPARAGETPRRPWSPAGVLAAAWLL